MSVPQTIGGVIKYEILGVTNEEGTRVDSAVNVDDNIVLLGASSCNDLEKEV